MPASAVHDPLVGKTLALNIEKASKFYTYGFSVNTKAYMATVPERAYFDALRKALEDGTLIDVSSGAEGIRSRDSSSSMLLPLKKSEPDLTKIVYFVQSVDDNGVPVTVMASPSSREEAEDWAAQMKVTGTIRLKPPPEDLN